jgi:very-short-patch-repair endonuclease
MRGADRGCGVVCGIRTPAAKPLADEAIVWFATRQHGRVARRQLLAAGVHRDAVARRVRSGLLLPGARGIYRVAHAPPTRFGKEMEASLACGPGALIGHRSATAIYGFLPYPAAANVWVTVTKARGTGFDGIILRRTGCLDPAEVRLIGWLPLTSPARTLVDLAGVVEEERLEQAVAAALQRSVTMPELRRQLARSNGRRGAKALRRLLDGKAAPAHTKSEAELRMLSLVRRSGLPEPEVNVWVGRYLVDFYWPDHDLVAEFDGYAFHSDFRSFRRDRERSNTLQLMGITVLRFTWHDLTRRPSALIARLRRGLHSA